MDWWRIVHILSMIWLGAGLGAVYLPILRAWASKDLEYQAYALIEAANSETRVLLPGAMATGTTGFFWAVAAEYNFVRDGWLGALTLSFIVVYLVCLPLLGFGLRRARLAVLIARRDGKTDELADVLADRVPIVFGTILVLSVPFMAWLAIFKPF
ncbi:MAG: DUF2269 family protein [Dehalococcoidia bacterium]|nr:DUF2269 family protein [Dehalococcoidia bacterium]MCA9845467.1 DUF2269 family protein [Dehalococcoidia bacterium]MCA9852820.1 DUF2269 family protein [Dehalococcoidia bacterium]